MPMNGEEDKFGMGIPTFMGGDYITDIEQTKDYDVAFLGVPIEFGASFRHGTARAASTLRQYSSWDRIKDSEYVDLDRDSVILHSKEQRIADLSDIVINETDPEGTIEKVIDFSGKIATNCLPVFIGGDHSVTYSTFQGARSRIEPGAKVGILHFDGHFDVEDDCPNMPRIWHGNVFRELINEGHFNGEDLFTIGVRSIVPKKWVDYAKDNGINYFTGVDVAQDKVAVIEQVKTGLSTYDYIYMTMDVDGIDSAYCSGTGVPRYNGLRPQDVTDILRACINKPLLAADVVEYSPNYDTNGQAAMMICELLYDMIAFRKCA